VGNRYLSIDLDWIKTTQQLNFVNQIVFSNKIQKFKFGHQHNSIYEYYKSKKDVVLYNVDHHHDMQVNSMNTVSECTWVHHLIVKNIVKEYHWVNNLSSIPFKGENVNNILLKNYLFQTYDEYEFLLNVDFEEVFICLSPEYLDPEYNLQPLYKTYINYCEVNQIDHQLMILLRDHWETQIKP
tara:strand:+ start:461 stop:1009 length:549 start_codon:yes stop_codon:yes gene_type:complete